MTRWTLILLAALGAGAARREPPLTPAGWGDLRVGMTEAEAGRRFGLRSTPVDGDCHYLELPHRTDLTGLGRAGRIGSLLAGDETRLRTDRGIGIGSTEADVRRAYGQGLKVEPNVFEPGHYMTWWAEAGRRGVMFETNANGRVYAIHVGDETILWTDGCG